MSIAKRFLDVARAEVASLFSRDRDADDDARLENEIERLKAKSREPVPKRSESERRKEPAQEPVRSEPQGNADVARWYANLELPYGATVEEVRAAYRRLMRRYHPDRHREDPGSEALASELVVGLREAHDGLVAHLSKR